VGRRNTKKKTRVVGFTNQLRWRTLARGWAVVGLDQALWAKKLEGKRKEPWERDRILLQVRQRELLILLLCLSEGKQVSHAQRKPDVTEDCICAGQR
jgi:hypothetical protein